MIHEMDGDSKEGKRGKKKGAEEKSGKRKSDKSS